MVYEDPDSIAGEFDTLYDALGFRSQSKARIEQNGITMAQERDSRWDLTQEGLQIEHERFANGSWSLEFPAKAGNYSVADRQGYLAGQRQLVYVKEELSDVSNIKQLAGTEWVGWWWTEPHPDLPRAPDADEEVN